MLKGSARPLTQKTKHADGVVPRLNGRAGRLSGSLRVGGGSVSSSSLARLHPLPPWGQKHVSETRPSLAGGQLARQVKTRSATEGFLNTEPWTGFPLLFTVICFLCCCLFKSHKLHFKLLCCFFTYMGNHSDSPTSGSWQWLAFAFSFSCTDLSLTLLKEDATDV